MTMGSMMFYGGIGGAITGVIGLLICLKIFPRQREKLLKKLKEE